MASSRLEPVDAAEPSPVAFALQELTACWSQAYEAMTRGDLIAVAHLLDEAQLQLATAGDGRDDTANEAHLRSQAASAHGRLQHAMKAGLDGLREELARVRRGAKALRGYGQPGALVDDSRLTKQA